MSSENQSLYRNPFFYGSDGRLIQVDAALEAVRRGSTTVGLKTDNYVLLASQVRPARPLMQPPEKTFVIDEHAGATGSGYVGDLMHLIEETRLQAQRYRLVYDTPIDIISLAKHLAGYFHSFTLYAVRPPGASVILAGADQQGLQLYLVEPGGTYFNGKAAAVGQESDKALEVVSHGYQSDLSLDAGLRLVGDAVSQASGEKDSIEFGVVRKEVGKFERLLPQSVPLP